MSLRCRVWLKAANEPAVPPLDPMHRHARWPFSTRGEHSRFLKTQHWSGSGNVKTDVTKKKKKSWDKTSTCCCKSTVVSPEWQHWRKAFSFVRCDVSLCCLCFTSLLPALGKTKNLTSSRTVASVLHSKQNKCKIPRKRALLSWLLLRTKAGRIRDS